MQHVLALGAISVPSGLLRLRSVAVHGWVLAGSVNNTTAVGEAYGLSPCKTKAMLAEPCKLLVPS